MTGSIKYELVRKVSLLSCKLNFVCACFIISLATLAPESNEMAIFCGCSAIAVSLLPIFYSIKRKDFTITMNCISLFNLAPIWFLYLESVLPGYDAYVYITPEYRMIALFWTCIFLVLSNMFYILLQPSITFRSVKYFSFLQKVQFNSNFYIRTTFLAFFIPLIGLFFFYGSLGELWKAMTEGREGGGGSGILKHNASGNDSSLLLPLTWIWQLVPVFGSIAFISARKTQKALSFLALAIGCFVIFITFLGGSRGTLMQVAAPPVFFLFYYNWHRGLRFWLFAVAAMILVVGVMELQVRFRGNLLDVLADPTAAAQEKGLKSATSFDATETHRDNNMYLLCLMVKGYPSKFDFEGFNDFFATIVNPIPRVIWPDKPVFGAQVDVSQLHTYIKEGPREMGTASLSVSVVGNAYISAGVFGLMIYAFIYAYFLVWFDGLIYYRSNDKPMIVALCGIGIFLAFWGFRDFFALVSFIYPVIILIIFLKYISRKRLKA